MPSPCDEWLVVVDRQKVFAESEWSDWACPDDSYHATDTAFARLARAYGSRVVYTRYIAPTPAEGAWIDYFKDWPQFLVPPDNPMYDLTDDTAVLAQGHTVVSRNTFGKWGDELRGAVHDAGSIALCGVATDCCVIATALAAADAGVAVRVAADACAGSSRENHQRALDTMALFAPLITITSSEEIMGR
jgi:nicotinamidase-related amidase